MKQISASLLVLIFTLSPLGAEDDDLNFLDKAESTPPKVERQEPPTPKVTQPVVDTKKEKEVLDPKSKKKSKDKALKESIQTISDSPTLPTGFSPDPNLETSTSIIEQETLEGWLEEPIDLYPYFLKKKETPRVEVREVEQKVEQPVRKKELILPKEQPSLSFKDRVSAFWDEYKKGFIIFLIMGIFALYRLKFASNTRRKY